MLSARSLWLLSALCIGGTPGQLTAQLPDSAFSAVTAAVLRSGVWSVDGEYKGSTGVFYKATGYWAAVVSPAEVSEGWNAVLAVYLEPYAGGQAIWLGARLYCQPSSAPGFADVQHCIAVEGATALLDVNFSIEPGAFSRFDSATVTLSEPEDKSATKRWTARTTSRGHFRLAPI